MNGKAVVTATNGKPAANGVKTDVILLPVPATKKEDFKKEIEDLPPLEDRLHRINQLFEVQSKYNRLQSSLSKLNQFQLEKQGERNRLSILDEQRNEFATHNPDIIAEVTSFLKAKITEKIKAIEPLLKW
jgi:hypothetical protein